MQLFNDHVVILAGGTGRVGGSTLATLVAEGARIMLLSRDGEHAARTIDVHVPAADRAHVLPFVADLEEAQAGARVTAACIDRFGRVDALVNMAGRGKFVALVDSKLDDVRANLDGFMVQSYGLTLPVLRAMLAQPMREGARARGNIVTVTAGSSRDPQPNFGLFGAAKAAVNTFMRAVAREHKADGIVANAVVLGGVATDAARAYLSEDEFAAAASPQEVADVLCFLASGRATGINGELIDLNAREVD